MIAQSNPKSWPRPPLAWYTVGVLLIAFLFSSIDRVILGLLVVPIKQDLGLSDAAMGTLLGIAFAAAFTITGLLVGVLADRYSRRVIVSVAVTIWSLATAACGLANNFVQLLIGRLTVAAGESALSPAAFSMISDSFPPKQLGRALGVYMSGAFFGAGISFLVGGAVLGLVGSSQVAELPLLGEVRIWQLAFFLVGLPGLLVGLLALTLTEPARRGVARQRPSGTEVFRFVLARKRLSGCHMAGFGMLAVVIVVVLSWAPTMFVRAHGLTSSQAGLQLGVILLIFSPAGIFTGGWLVDTWQRAGRSDAPLLVGIVAALTTLPFAIVANTTTDGRLALLLHGPFVFFASLAVACGPTAIQLAVPNEFRAQLSATYLMALNILTAAFGATGVGFATDYVFRDEQAIGYSIALVIGVCAPTAALLLWAGRTPFREARAREAEILQAEASLATASA
ncbi:MAG: MFS transporter [Steroidobacteraceae bacterium]